MLDDRGCVPPRHFLIGYDSASIRDGVRVRLAGVLGREGAELLQACMAHVNTAAVSRVCFDLSALEEIDDAGAQCLVAMCSGLRLDGFQVDIHGLRVEVGAMLVRRKLDRRSGRADPDYGAAD